MYNRKGELTQQGVYYLHRDYLGSIVGISDSGGKVVEKRHYGAWGALEKYESNDSSLTEDHPLLDRGWTGHEYFAAVHLVHMNGRMYDTDLRRFLSPDNYVQDPSNTQNYNRYQYGYNNPLKYSDPSGEFLFLAAIIIGAIVGGASYAVNAAITGKWSWGGFFKAIVMGGVSGAISFGIGSWTASMKGILSTVVNISAHAVASGAESLVQGGKFLAGALAGGISAGIAKGVSALTSAAKRMNTFVKSAITIASGGVSGGIGSALGGGKFIDGFRQGVITAGLNHVAHEIEGNIYAKRFAKQQAIARLRVTCERVMAQGNAMLDGGPGDGISARYLLWKLYWHYQFGGKEPLTIDASTLDFSGTSQS